MKRSRPSSRKLKALPTGQGTCLGVEGLTFGTGVTKGTVQRRAEAKVSGACNRPRPSRPPMADRVEVTLAEADFLNARWDKDMDTLLRVGVLRYGGAWEEVSTHMAPHGCPKDEVEKRWHMVKNNRVKGPWALEEDTLLKLLVTEYGKRRWSVIAGQFPGRTGKQCRERWLNHVDPNVKTGAWTAAEDVVLCEAQERLGNKWASISKFLPGRAENAIKNRFNSLRTKRMALYGGLNSTKPGHNFNEGEERAEHDTSELKRRAPIGFESVEAIPRDLSEDDGVTPAFIGDEGYRSLLGFSYGGPDQKSNIFGHPCNKIGEGVDDAKFLQSFFDLLEHHPMSPPACKRRRRNAPSETSPKAMDESRNRIQIEVKDKEGGGGAVGPEGEAMGDITTAGLDHHPFRLEDVIPTPLEIGSFGGGPEDITLMSSLGSYLTPLESRSVGSGQSSVAQTSCRPSLGGGKYAHSTSEPSPSYWRRGLHEANGTPPLSEGRTARVSPNLDSSDGGAKRRGAVDVISSDEQNFDDCVSPYPMSTNSATLRLATQGIPTAPVMREQEHMAAAKGYGAEASFEYFRETSFLSSPLVGGAGEGPRTSANFSSGGFI